MNRGGSDRRSVWRFYELALQRLCLVRITCGSAYWSFLFVGAVLSCGACHRSLSPEATESQIRTDIRRGHLDAAEQAANSALAAYETHDPVWTARFRVIKARILMMRGSYLESLRLLSDALPADLAKTDTEVERRMVQGLDYDYLRQFPAADEATSLAESLAASTGSPLTAAVAQTRGIIEVDQRNYARAAKAFRAAMTYGREHNLPRAELDALANLGNVAMWEEHYDEAVDRFTAALEKSRMIGAHDVEAKTLGNLAWSKWVIGDFEGAERGFRDAEQTSGELGLAEDQTYWLIALADVQGLQHRFSEAEATGRKALSLAETHDDKSTLVTCLSILARNALSTDRLQEAEKLNQRAREIANTTRNQPAIAYSQLIAGRIAAARQDYAAALLALRSLLADPQAETRLKWEAHTRLAEIYAAQKLSAKAELEFNIAIRTIQSVRDSIHSDELRVSFLSSAIEFFDAYIRVLIEQNRPLDALRVADLSRSQSLDEGLAKKVSRSSGLKPFDPQSIARRTSATLLFYWLGPVHSWLWVVTPARTSLLILPPSQEIDPLVRSYRDSFTDARDPLEAGNVDGKKLYATLVQPAEKFLPKNSRVIVLPDGSLNSLNFETLVVAAPQPHYWIDDVTLSTANSLALFARGIRSLKPAGATLLVVGDALSANPDFPQLPQAAREVALVEKYFPGNDRVSLTGKGATPSAVLGSQLERFSYLHFATHGTASRLRPLESAVILSPQADSGFKLYARDILQHPLNAYLVTISACNGAGTKTYAGEGLIGLSWAFLRAGAHNVIAGLWEVSEASTPQLMNELYKGLKSGQDPATALRNAKLTLVHSTSIYRKPFYWAPFLLYSGS